MNNSQSIPMNSSQSIPPSGLQIRTMNEVWANTLEKFPRKTAVIAEGVHYSYEKLEEMIASAAGRLAHGCKVGRGDRVSIMAPNTLEFYITYWAVLRCGAVLVPINYRQSAEQVRFILEETEPKVLIVDKACRKMFEKSAKGSGIKVYAIGFESADAEGFENLLKGDSPLRDSHLADEDDLAVIVYTSGTTGMPKGPMISHANLLFNIKNTIIPHSFRHEDIHLLVVPLFHCTGLNTILTTSAFLGSTIVLASRPEPAQLLELIEHHHCTTFIGVPTLLHLVTMTRELKERNTSTLRLVAYSGSPMRPALIKILRDLFPGVALHNFFGLTETISITHVLADCDALPHADSVGKLLPEVGQKIIDEKGKSLPVNTIGELCFRRENVVRGYWKRPGLLEKSITEDGWVKTGDLALVNDEGFLILKGRSKDMIIVGGENVYATEVENIICKHSEVMEAAVVGIEATGVRAYLGELVKAVVVAKSGAAITDRDIKEICTKNLPSYAVPAEVVFTEALPRTPSGKVIKAELP